MAALPSPRAVGRPLPDGFLSPLSPKASAAAAVTAASCEETRMPGGRGGTGTGQRDELISRVASKAPSLGKTSPPSGV